MTPPEKSPRKNRLAKIGACAILGLGALRLTVLKPASNTVGNSGLAPAGATTTTEPVPSVTSPPIELERDPFLPVNGG